jgi:hypothetical protein
MLLASALALAPPASAEPSVEPTVAEILRTAEAVAGPAEVVVEVEHDTIEALVAGADVAVTADSATIEVYGGPAVTIGLPGDGAGDEVDGAMVIEGSDPDADLVARPTEDGAQVLVVIDGPAAPARYDFPIEVDGAPAALTLLADGSVEVRPAAGSDVAATITAPWAVDAQGTRVPTAYEIHGSDLVQTVDHDGAAYPVVADPNTCGIVTCTYYFGKVATRDISAAKNATVGCGWLWKVPAAAAGCGVAWAAVSIQADRAHARKMCLKIKYTKSWPVVWYPDIYSGKYCK